MASTSFTASGLSSMKSTVCYFLYFCLIASLHLVLTRSDCLKDPLLQAGLLLAVGPGYWMLCFSIKREMTSDTINRLVVGANMLCVDTLMILRLYYGHTLVPVKDFCVLFRAPHPGCPEAFLEPSRVGRKENETLNTGNTNLLVNFAEKQIGLHNHKRSGTKGPLSCIAALVSCFIKT